MSTIDETIDFVIASDIVHDFSSSKQKKIKTSSSSVCIEVCSSTNGLDQSFDIVPITNTLSCSHENGCSCQSLVKENKNIRGPSNRNYTTKMLNKAKSQFSLFYDLFKYYGKTGEEKILFQKRKKERFEFLELNWQSYSDEHTYHKTIKTIMDVMNTNCPYCFESRFLKASEGAPVQFLTSDCGHSFCVPCFRMEKRVKFLI